MLDIELHSDRSRKIADERLADSVHSDMLLKQRILGETECGADGEPAQLRSAHQGEINGDEQRQFDGEIKRRVSKSGS